MKKKKQKKNKRFHIIISFTRAIIEIIEITHEIRNTYSSYVHKSFLHCLIYYYYFVLIFTSYSLIFISKK